MPAGIAKCAICPILRRKEPIMPRPILALGLAALLAACSPAEQCRLDATRDVRLLDRMIAETRTDLGRGYRLIPIEDPFQIGLFGCFEPSEIFAFCRDDAVPRYRRQALNRPAEEAKLASLLAQRRTVEVRTQQALADCPQA
jgi:hypothetical protein